MWKEIIGIFKSSAEAPIGDIEREFREMVNRIQDMARIVRPKTLDVSVSDVDRGRVYELDVQVNKLERSIRKRVIAHLSLQQGDVSYCLLMMTLVKDVERVGDYLKNVSEISMYGATPIPAGRIRDELSELIDLAHTMIEEAPGVMDRQDSERAAQLMREGRQAAKRCDALLVELSKSDLDAAQTTATVLTTRFYKRLGGHQLNIISSVVMPLHKVDYYDERYLDDETADDSDDDT